MRTQCERIGRIGRNGTQPKFSGCTCFTRLPSIFVIRLHGRFEEQMSLGRDLRDNLIGEEVQITVVGSFHLMSSTAVTPMPFPDER